MIVKRENLKKICCNEEYIEELRRKSEADQKRIYIELVSICRYYQYYRYHFLSRFYEECIWNWKACQGTKEEFEEYLCKAEQIVKEAQDFFSSDLVLDDIQDISHFVPGKQGNLFAIFQEQFNWDEDDIGQSLIHQSEYYVRKYMAFIHAIQDVVLNDREKPEEKWFWSRSPRADKKNKGNYSKLCCLLKSMFQQEHRQRTQDLIESAWTD